LASSFMHGSLNHDGDGGGVIDDDDDDDDSGGGASVDVEAS